MTYEVKFETDEEKQERWKKDFPSGIIPYYERESYYSTLIIKYNGVEIARHSDGGEPEDNSFGRDWSWVPDALLDAYQKGLEDGLNNAASKSNDY